MKNYSNINELIKELSKDTRKDGIKSPWDFSGKLVYDNGEIEFAEHGNSSLNGVSHYVKKTFNKDIVPNKEKFSGSNDATVIYKVVDNAGTVYKGKVEYDTAIQLLADFAF